MGLLCIALAALLAVVVTMLTGAIGWPFAVIFGLTALAVTWRVDPRGLFLTVASQPLIFFVFLVAAGWVNTRSNLPQGASAFSKTALLTSAFPAVQHFPTLLIIVVLCALLAVLRLWRGKAAAEHNTRRAQVTRRAEAAANRRTNSERLSVAELVARDRAEDAEYRQRQRRIRERDREARRREQAKEREEQARKRVEAGRPQREAAERSAAQRLDKARAASASGKETSQDSAQNAAQDYDADRDFAPRRPDPTRRAGDTLSDSARTARASGRYSDHFKAAAEESIRNEKERLAQKQAQREAQRAGKNSTLNENLYED